MIRPLVLAATILAPPLALAQTAPSALNLVGSAAPSAFDTTGPKFGSGALIPSKLAGNPVSLATGTCDLRAALQSTWTLSFWVQFPPNLPASSQAVISMGNLYLAEASSVFSGGGLTLTNQSQNLNVAAGAPYDANNTSVLTDGAWHHIEIDNGGYAYPGSSTSGPWIYAFLDGKTLFGINEGVFGTGGPIGLVTLGSLPLVFANKGTFGGEIDEVALFNGTQHPLPTLTTFGGNTFLLPGQQAFTPPRSPFVGNETNLELLYHLDASGADSSPTIPASPVQSGGTTIVAQPTCGAS